MGPIEVDAGGERGINHPGRLRERADKYLRTVRLRLGVSLLEQCKRSSRLETSIILSRGLELAPGICWRGWSSTGELG